MSVFALPAGLMWLDTHTHNTINSNSNKNNNHNNVKTRPHQSLVMSL